MRYHRWRNGFDLAWHLAVILAIILAIVTVLTASCIAFARHIQRQQCEGFGENSGRVVKIVDYGYFNNLGCLTPLPDGRWISVDNLRGNETS